jgi:hypothetical protein
VADNECVVWVFVTWRDLKQSASVRISVGIEPHPPSHKRSDNILRSRASEVHHVVDLTIVQ